ncbi:MAG: VWA domain-containing protein [Acidobacteriaceae bacterium]|jgi:VWFA-related protein
MQLRTRSLIALGLVLTLPAFVAGAAQTDPTAVDQFAAPSSQGIPQSSVPTLHVTTREIVVDVEVTDANGNPVHGLKQSDFSIEENGKPQPIRSFREFGTEIPVAEPAPPKLPLGVYTNSQSTPASGPVNILLIDALHSDSLSIVRGLQGATGYLTTMPQGTRVAIFWLSQSGTHMLQGFTSDRDSLLRAVRTGRTDFGACLNGQCLVRYQIDRTTIDAMNQIAAYVAGIKGRKNLLWITPGMPVDLMRDGGYAWAMDGRGRPVDIDMSLVHRLMDAYERFTAEQIAVSPVDPRGVLTVMGMAQLKAEAVAADTGGEAFYNSNDLKASIAKAVSDGSWFYTLTYIPPKQKDDGHYHRIKVELVDQPKLHLVYRQGYNAERVPTQDAPAPGPALMKASMEGKAPVATQILFDVGVWPGALSNPASGPQPQPVTKSKAGKTVRYELHYGFPPSEIAFTEEPDGTLHGSLEFDAVAYDVFGKRVALLTQTVAMNLTPVQYDEFVAKHAYSFVQQLDLPLGQISLHVGILDNISSKVGTLEAPVYVRPVNPSQRAAAPPKR